MGNTAAVADLIAMTIRAALAPVLAQHATLTERCSQMDARLSSMEPAVTLLRERMAVTETRSFIPGPAGKDGADGADGFSCDELTAVQDPADQQLITLSYRRGDQQKTIGTLRLTVPSYTGTFKDGQTYTKGQMVTDRGSMWFCHTDTGARPGDGVTGWTLAVKCGRDGKDSR